MEGKINEERNIGGRCRRRTRSRLVCKLHHDLVMANPTARIACPECGAESTELIWDTVS